MQDYKDYFKQYNRDNRVRLSLNLNKESDKDIIDAITRANKENTQGAIKSLIRAGLDKSSSDS